MYLHGRNTFLEKFKSVLPNILEQSDSFINNVFLLGDISLYDSSSKTILNTTINYITSAKKVLWFYDNILRGRVKTF